MASRFSNYSQQQQQPLQQADQDMPDTNEHVPNSQSSLQEEYCPITNEPYVAYCSKTGRLLTNQDIY